MTNVYRIALNIILAIPIVSYGQNDSSDAHKTVSLDSVVVYGGTVGTQLRTNVDGALLWNMGMLNDMPKILGNADPLHYAQMLPGVSTANEYDAGFHVLGCETSHNYVTIDGAPLYGISHLLGIFSVFNASHFQQMRLNKSASYASSPHCLGAEINMQTHYQPTDTITGEASVGILSSQGTVRIPLARESELGISFRTSYINLLYKSLLKEGDTSLGYSFYDANATYNNVIDDKNRLRINFYAGNDHADMQETVMMSTMSVKWGNLLASALWTYDDAKIHLTENLFYTHSHTDGLFDMTSLSCQLPSSIKEIGNKMSVTWRSWRAGVDFSAYFVSPQQPIMESALLNINVENETKKTLLLSSFVEKNFPLLRNMNATAGARASYFCTESKDYVHLSPAVNIAWHPIAPLNFTLGYSYKHQYLTKTGMSSINTPLEFWLPSGIYGIKPQTAHSINLAARYVSSKGVYSVSAEAYAKWLNNQTEYNGTIYSFLSSKYDIEKMLLRGRGRNYGFDVVVSKNKGKVTGWLAYAYSKSLRTYNTDVLKGTFPSSHERPHEINGVITLHVGKRWDIGLTGVWATGTPFTAPKQYYLLNRTLVAEFAQHNSNRLRPYFRIDGSVNFHFTPSRNITEHGVNLSVYNITSRKQELFYYMEMNSSEYRLNCLYFLMRVLPSVSYYLKF